MKRKNLNYDYIPDFIKAKKGDEVYTILESWGCTGIYYRCRRYGKVKEVIKSTGYRVIEWEYYTSVDKDR
jgi:hypothetical protein